MSAFRRRLHKQWDAGGRATNDTDDIRRTTANSWSLSRYPAEVSEHYPSEVRNYPQRSCDALFALRNSIYKRSSEVIAAISSAVKSRVGLRSCGVLLVLSALFALRCGHKDCVVA